MLKRLLLLLAMLTPALAFAATPNITVNLVPGTQPPHVVKLLLGGGSSASYASGITSGSSIAPIAVTMSDGSTYDGTVALSGTNASKFTATNTSLNANSTTPTCTASTPYPLTISAPPGRGEGGSTVSIDTTVTCSPSAQTIASITQPSSCTFTHGQSSNCPVSVAMSPAAPPFSGSLSLVASGGSCSGTEDTTDFGTSNSPYAITFNGSAAAGTHGTCLKATQGSSSAYKQVAITINSSSTPSPPAAVTSAGLTTLAMNMDFSGATTSSFKGSTVNINDVSGDSTAWLYCYVGAAANPTNPVWQLAPAWTNAADCSRVFLTSDGGTNSLDIQWQPSDSQNSIGATEIDTWPVNQDATGPAGTAFPLGSTYIEWQARSPQSTYDACGGTQCIFNDVWSWPSSTDGVEWDFIEIPNTFSPYSACFPHNGGTCGTFNNFSTTADYTQYHTYGVLITTDGTNMDECGFFDGNFIGCAGQFAPGDGGYTVNERSFLRITVGLQNLPSPVTPSGNMDMLFKYFRVWSCPSWQTTQCNTTVYNGP